MLVVIQGGCCVDINGLAAPGTWEKVQILRAESVI